MGFLSGLMGIASEADADNVEEQLKDFVLPDENVIKAYQLVRDLTILTDRRIILIHKQGSTGRRTEYVCIPYRSIVKYSIETRSSRARPFVANRFWLCHRRCLHGVPAGEIDRRLSRSCFLMG